MLVWILRFDTIVTFVLVLVTGSTQTPITHTCQNYLNSFNPGTTIR